MLIDVLKQSGVIEKINEIKSCNKTAQIQNNTMLTALLFIVGTVIGSNSVLFLYKMGIGFGYNVLINLGVFFGLLFVSVYSYMCIISSKTAFIQNTQLENEVSASSVEFFKDSDLGINCGYAKLFYFEKQQKFAYIYIQRVRGKVNVYIAHEPGLVIQNIWALLHNFQTDNDLVMNDETINSRAIAQGISEIKDMSAFMEKQVSVKQEMITKQDLNLLNEGSFEKELLKEIRIDAMTSLDKESLYSLINQYKSMENTNEKEIMLIELKAIVKLIKEGQAKITSDMNQNIQYFKAKYSTLNQ